MRVKFEQLFCDVTKYAKKIPKEKYLLKGTYPIIDQGQSKIAGYVDDEEGLFCDVPAIIFGDHTRKVKYVDSPCFLGADGVKLLKVKTTNVNSKYLFYALSSAKVPDTGYNRHFKWIKEMDFLLPSLEKQNHIVDVLDKICSLIEMRKQQLGKLDELVKSRFIEMFGDMSETEYVTIENVCSTITDGTHQPPEFVAEGIPFLFVSNIITNQISYDTEKFISEETYSVLIKRTPIEVGDILLSTVGSYGHPAIVQSTKKFCFQRHIAYLKPKKEMINSEYLHSAILSGDVRRQIDERVKGIAQKTLNLSEIRKIRLPLPSLDRQNQFAAFVQVTHKSELAVQKSLEELELLKKSLMQEYFG